MKARDYEKQKELGLAVIRKHPNADLHFSEIKALFDQYKADEKIHNSNTEAVLNLISNVFLFGVAAGSRNK